MFPASKICYIASNENDWNSLQPGDLDDSLDKLASRLTTQEATGSGDVTGPSSSVSSNLASYNGTTGKLIRDSGLRASRVVEGPTLSTDTFIPVFDGVTGQLLKESAGSISGLGALGGVSVPATLLSGNIADALVQESNVTQHEAAVNHDALTNFVVDEHHLVDFGMNTSDQSLASSTTLTNVTGLAVSVVNGGTYQITGMLAITCASSTPDIRIAVTFGTMSTFMLGINLAKTNGRVDADHLIVSGTQTNLFTIVGGNELVFLFSGACVATANGTIQIQYKQNTSSVTPIIAIAGSYLRAERMA